MVAVENGRFARDDQSRGARITSTQLRAMRSTKTPTLADRVTRALTGLRSSLESAVGFLFASKREKKSFCELNGHSVKMVGGVVTNQCRFCETEINSIDMLSTR